MTKALRKAFEAASRLPDRDQDELAAAILEELAGCGKTRVLMSGQGE